MAPRALKARNFTQCIPAIPARNPFIRRNPSTKRAAVPANTAAAIRIASPGTGSAVVLTGRYYRPRLARAAPT